MKYPNQFLYLKNIYVKNNFFMCLVGFQASKIKKFFGKFTVKLVRKSFSGKNYSLDPFVFWFSNSLPYDLEESREFLMLISWVLGQ